MLTPSSQKVRLRSSSVKPVILARLVIVAWAGTSDCSLMQSLQTEHAACQSSNMFSLTAMRMIIAMTNASESAQSPLKYVGYAAHRHVAGVRMVRQTQGKEGPCLQTFAGMLIGQDAAAERPVCPDC